MFITILLSIFSLSFADYTKRDQSFICPDKYLKDNSAICCDQLPGLSCEESQQHLLNKYQADILQQLTDKVITEEKYKVFAPNCFWTSLKLLETPATEDWWTIDPSQFIRAVGEGYRQLKDDEEVTANDLIVFVEVGEYLRRYENEYGGKKFKWEKDEEIIHAGVYLGRGMMVQKENTYTAVSSLSTLDRSYNAYRAVIKKVRPTEDYASKKTDLMIRYYRRIK